MPLSSATRIESERPLLCAAALAIVSSPRDWPRARLATASSQRGAMSRDSAAQKIARAARSGERPVGIGRRGSATRGAIVPLPRASVRGDGVAVGRAASTSSSARAVAAVGGEQILRLARRPRPWQRSRRSFQRALNRRRDRSVRRQHHDMQVASISLPRLACLETELQPERTAIAPRAVTPMRRRAPRRAA